MNKRFISILAVLLTLGLWFSHQPRGEAEYGDFQKEMSTLGLDIYQHTYDKYDDLKTKTAVDRTVETINKDSKIQYTGEEVKKIRDGDYSGLPGKFQEAGYTSVSQENLLQEISTKVNETLAFEQDVADYELSLKMETGTLGLYSNGTLDDSDFDLIVDLNKIDVIYFGEQAKLPVAYWGSASGMGNSGGNNSSEDSNSNSRNNNGSGSQNGNQNAGGSQNNNGSGGVNTNSSSVNQNQNATTGGNTNTNSTSTNANTNGAVCADPDAFTLDDDDLQNELDQLEGAQGGNGNTNSGNGNNNGSGNNGGISGPLPGQETTFELDADGYASLPDNPAGDSGYSTETDAEGSAEWPCNSFFCIKISMKSGTGPSSYSKQDNSIMAHSSYMYQYLDNLGRYPLAQKCTTRQFWGIGTNGINLSEHLHLNVVTSKKPVWSPKRHEYGSDNSTATKEKVASEQGKANNDANTMQGVPPEQACDEIASQQNIGTTSQEVTTAKLAECILYQFQKNREQATASKLNARLNKSTIDSAPLTDQVNEMYKMIGSIRDILFEKDKGLRDTAKLFLNKPQTK